MYLNVRHATPSENLPEDNTTVAKATAMVVLFLASFSIGTFSIKLNQWFKWNSGAKSNDYVNILLGMGGGVLMCTTFLHLLPEVSESFDELNLTPDFEVHYAEMLMCLGFFTMYFVEECVHLYLHKREESHNKELERVIRKSLSIRRGHFEGARLSSSALEIPKHLQEKEQHNHVGHSHNHQDHSHIIIEEDTEDSTVKTIRGLLVVLALSVHELFEGLAVGLETSSANVWYMFGAVCAHKLVIAFCIGVELVTSGMRNTLVIIYVFTFAVVSPLGIGIGMIVTNNQESSTALVSVILQGLASGTLLYVVFFEILQAERKDGLKQFFSVLVGFLIMLGITMLG